MSTLDLSLLKRGLPAITPDFGGWLAEAAAVCLESEGHEPGQTLDVRGEYTDTLSLLWSSITDQAKRCLNDPEEATEYGATGVAILLVRQLAGVSVIERSRKGTGFDYWLGDENDLPFQNKARLEISGIKNGDDTAIRSRVRMKLKQTIPSDNTSLPAYIVVVEFGRPVSEIAKK